MRCDINQAVGIPHINYIIIITDSIHIAKKIFDLLLYPYQIYSAAISGELRDFFSKDINNCIKFWDCSSNENQLLYLAVDKDSKRFDLSLSFPCKLSWDFCKKHDCNSILSQWRMFFQVSDNKEKNFLKLLDNELNPLELLTIKGSSQLQHLGYSNILCAGATRAIINHAPIGEYQLRFFSREEFMYPCSLYSIKSRQHILYECTRFNNYQNPRRDSIGHFTLFLEFNSNTFIFDQSFTLLYFFFSFFSFLLSSLSLILMQFQFSCTQL